MNAIVDTDALLGLFNSNDVHHTASISITKRIIGKSINIFILPTTLSEFALLASSRIGMRQAQKAVSHLVKSDFLTIDITKRLTEDAVNLYERQTSKEESLFDCFIMAVAKKLNACCIFSFDHGYAKNGFVLAEDFLKQ